MFFQFFRVVKMSAESNKRKSKCYFKDEWLQHKDYNVWIKKVPDDEQKAYSVYDSNIGWCLRNISLRHSCKMEKNIEMPY